jgi:hypothetical protein
MRTVPDFQNSSQVGDIKDTARVTDSAQLRAKREHAQPTGREHVVVTGCEEPFDHGVATLAGFSLHAGVAARADQRQKLERLSHTPNGDVRYRLKTPPNPGGEAALSAARQASPPACQRPPSRPVHWRGWRRPGAQARNTHAARDQQWRGAKQHDPQQGLSARVLIPETLDRFRPVRDFLNLVKRQHRAAIASRPRLEPRMLVYSAAAGTVGVPFAALAATQPPRRVMLPRLPSTTTRCRYLGCAFIMKWPKGQIASAKSG